MYLNWFKNPFWNKTLNPKKKKKHTSIFLCLDEEGTVCVPSSVLVSSSLIRMNYHHQIHSWDLCISSEHIYFSIRNIVFPDSPTNFLSLQNSIPNDLVLLELIVYFFPSLKTWNLVCPNIFRGSVWVFCFLFQNDCLLVTVPHAL